MRANRIQLVQLLVAAISFCSGSFRKNSFTAFFAASMLLSAVSARAALIDRWRADDLVTLKDGDTVGAWNSASNRVALAAVGLPIFKRNVTPAGSSAVRFNRNRMSIAASLVSGRSAFSLAYVFRANVPGANDAGNNWYGKTGIVDAEQSGVTADWGTVLTETGNVGIGTGNPDISTYSVGASLVESNYHVAVFTWGGGMQTVYVDDRAPVSASGVSTGVRNASAFSFGGINTDENGSVRRLVGDLVEVRFYDTEITALEASNVVAELRDAHLFGPFPLIITSQPVGQTNVIGSPAITLSVGVEGSNPYYQWYADGNAVPSGNSASYTVMTGKTNAGVNYSVIATNILGRVTSSVARVLILTDTLPIKLLSVVGPSGPLNNQCVASFDKTLLTATSTNLANYSITVLGTTDALAITNITVGGPTVRLKTTTNFIISTDYLLTVYNVTGTNLIPIQPNPSSVGITQIRTNPPPIFTNLISMDQRWDWNETGLPLGTDWRSPNYVEDSTWGSGAGIFYFDNIQPRSGCLAGLGEPVSQGLTTYYFRTSFIAPAGVSSSGVLRLRHFIDDGAVFYLNGVEFSRFKMPTGQIDYGTLAQLTSAPACVTNTVAVNNALLPGRNVLAVEVHQAQALNDPDVYFGLALDYTTNFTVLVTNIPAPPIVRLVQQSPATQVVSWPDNSGGFHWGLEYNDALTSNGWIALPDTSPFTNSSGPGQRYFRSGIK